MVMTAWWGDEPTQATDPAAVADSAKVAAMAGFEPSGMHEPGGVAVMPSPDAAAVAALTGMQPSTAHAHMWDMAAKVEAEQERRVAELQSDRARDVREAREGLVAAGVLPAVTAAELEAEHAKAYRDAQDPEPAEPVQYGEIPEQHRGGDADPVAVAPVLAEALALAGDEAHRSILLEAKRARRRQRTAGRQQARTVSRSQPAGPMARYVCGDPRCECGASSAARSARPGRAAANPRAAGLRPTW